MPKIEWTKKFSVGVTEIDEQHKKWIEIINRLHDAIMIRSGGKDLSESILNEMLEYTEFHFSFEEKFLEEQGYPGLEGHKCIHEYYKETLRLKLRDRQSGDLVLSREVMQMLTDWLQAHILDEDMQYSLYLEAK